MGKVTLRWVQGKMMVGTDSVGHSIVIGRSPEDDSQFAGMKPSDLLILAAASCSTHDIIEILQKQRQPLQNIKVICSSDQQPDPPNTFKNIHLHYIIHGQVDPQKAGRAIQLSEDKYCSVISTLRLGIPVTSDFEILD